MCLALTECVWNECTAPEQPGWCFAAGSWSSGYKYLVKESQSGLERTLRLSHSKPPALGRDTSRHPRLLQAVSSWTWTLPGTGHPQFLWASTTPPSQGRIPP